jgi:uncharacterized protein YkwD
MVEGLNSVRAKHGLRPLRRTPVLSNASRRHSHTLVVRDVLMHSSMGMASKSFDGVGEVLEMHSGRNPRVGYAIRLWMRSSSHRNVLLHPAMRWIGAGSTTGRFRGRRSTVWVVQVGIRRRR